MVCFARCSVQKHLVDNLLHLTAFELYLIPKPAENICQIDVLEYIVVLLVTK